MKAEIERIEQLEGRKFDCIRVTASPFARTISTGVEIAKEIGAGSIHLDYAWVEALYPTFYAEDPLPGLEARKLGNEGLAKQHGNIEFTSSEEQYRTVGLGVYPETKPARESRVWRNFNQVCESVVHE